MSIQINDFSRYPKGEIMSIVERIKEKCKEQNTSMNALEKLLGFGNGSIRLWNKKIPGSDKVILVAKQLNVSIDWLLTGKEASDLTQEEKKLVELYRNTNDIGQPLTMKHAEDIQQALPRIDQIQEQKSLNSQIG